MKLCYFFDEKLIKFILVGIINTLIGSLIMFTLYNVVHVNYWLSSACNYIFTSILSFFLNRYFTFAVKNWTLYMIGAFIVNIALCYLIAYGIARPVMNHVLVKSPQRIRENFAMFTGMCIFTGLNYVGQRFMVFRKQEESCE